MTSVVVPGLYEGHVDGRVRMIDFSAAAEALAHLIGEVGADDLRRPTPCDDYTVADLLMHIDEGATGFTAVADGAISSPAVTDVEDAGSRLRAADHVRDLGRAWLLPRAWAGDSDLAGLELANETWGKIALTEVLVHGWDLAVATGHAFAVPEHLVRACHDHVEVFVPAAPVPELWGESVAGGETMPLLDRTVAITGRDPRAWHLAPQS